MAQEIIPRIPPILPTAMEVVKEHRAFYRKGTLEYKMFSGIIAAARYRRDTLHILQLLRDAVLPMPETRKCGRPPGTHPGR